MKAKPPKEKGGSTENARRLKSNLPSLTHEDGLVNAYGTAGDILKQACASVLTQRLLLKPTKSEKIKATLKAKAEKFKSQTITVDENWSIVRLDELNWQIRHKDQRVPYDKWFFGTLRGALLALPDKMIGDEAKNAIADVSRSYRGFCEAVLNAMPEGSGQ
jgi:hypothetical protein